MASYLAACRVAAGAFGAAIAILPVGARVLLRERSAVIGRLDFREPIDIHLDSVTELSVRQRSCKKEPETVWWIEEFFVDGDVFFDIGANIGAYSLVAAQSHKGKVSVYAFEPSFLNFTQLCKNILLNRTDCVTPVPIALSNETGTVTFNFSSLETGAARHGFGSSTDQKDALMSAAHSMRVFTMTLDEVLARFALPSPNHIKIDVDGPELHVLQGACGALRDSALKTVLIELEPKSAAFPQIIQLMRESGFVARFRRSRGDGGDGTTNMIFVRAHEAR